MDTSSRTLSSRAAISGGGIDASTPIWYLRRCRPGAIRADIAREGAGGGY